MTGGAGARRLVVLRHAHATSGAGLPDIERPLSERGETEAAAAGAWLAAQALGPDLVICSVARRTRETYGIVERHLTPAPPVAYETRAYEAGLDDLLAVVQETPEEHDTVLLVGHNPGVYQLVLSLAGGAERGFPPGSAAVIELDREWGYANPGTGRLLTRWAP
ncbi:MAG: histidine phosphatase family protein [Streptosporangiales bacterium]|nr:histidine phosphatase family protein [Streptosporangiales bacterium]